MEMEMEAIALFKVEAHERYPPTYDDDSSAQTPKTLPFLLS